MSKYKYYFRKPRSEIAKDIIFSLLVTGAIFIAASSPYFGINLLRNVKRFKKYKKRNVIDTFKRLQKRGSIEIGKDNYQIYIRLTEEGKRLAGWMQIDKIGIKRPKKWDNKWRIVIFDIAQMKKTHREAFRGKLKELGFYPLQKSVWIHPFNCYDEVGLLRDFFGLAEREVRLIESSNIGSDAWLRKIFKL